MKELIAKLEANDGKSPGPELAYWKQRAIATSDALDAERAAEQRLEIVELSHAEWKARALAAEQSLRAVEAERDGFRKVLHKIGYDPFGDPEASYTQVLEAVTECARAALASTAAQKDEEQ